MEYVFTWPSDCGPCRLQVPAGVFHQAAATNAHGFCELGVIRFPAPPRGRAKPIHPEPEPLSVLSLLGLVVAAVFIVLAFQELDGLGDLARSESSSIPALKTRARTLV